MKKVLFPNITYWLLLFIPLTVIGFYPTYFSQIFASVPSIYHIHAFFMLLWIALAILKLAGDILFTTCNKNLEMDSSPAFIII